MPAVFSASSVMWVYISPALSIDRRSAERRALAFEAAARREVALHADDRLDAGGLGLLVEVVGAEDVAVVGHRERRHAHARGLFEEVVQPGGAVEHRVLGVHVQVDEGVVGHARDLPGTATSWHSGPRWAQRWDAASGAEDCGHATSRVRQSAGAHSGGGGVPAAHRAAAACRRAGARVSTLGEAGEGVGPPPPRHGDEARPRANIQTATRSSRRHSPRSSGCAAPGPPRWIAVRAPVRPAPGAAPRPTGARDQRRRMCPGAAAPPSATSRGRPRRWSATRGPS